MTKIDIENLIQPGKTYRVDAGKYAAMRGPYLSVLPSGPPGLTPAEILAAVTPRLPADHFPAGAKAGWWAKAVQLDLEAKGLVARAAGRPVRLYRAG